MESPAASNEEPQVVQARKWIGFMTDSKIEFVGFFAEADGVSRHEENSNNTYNPRDRSH